MFGKSTASRFNVQKKTETPGPGEYDIKELKTTKRGGISKMERKFEYQKGSEFTHLGPGTYVAPSLLSDAKGVAAFAAPAADMDTATAMKKLAASWQKLYGGDTAKATIKDKDDVVSFLQRLVAEGSAASSETISLSDESNSVRSRLAEEVALALKPGRQQLSSSSSSSACSMSTWKKVEPLNKAAEQANAATRKKMEKLSSILAGLSDNIPAMVQVLAEPEREKELQQQVEEATERADAAEEALDASLKLAREVADKELEEVKRKHAMASTRAEALERLVDEGSKRMQELESRMAASAEEHSALVDSLMALVTGQAQANGGDDGLDMCIELEELAERLDEAKRGESEALEELSALRNAYFTDAFAASDTAIAKDRDLEQAEEAARQAADDALGEIHSYMELLETSRAESRKLRKELAGEKAGARSLRKKLAEADRLLAEEQSRPVETIAELGDEADSLLGWMSGAVVGHVAGEGEDGVVQALFDEVMRLQTELEEARDTVVELTVELNNATGLRCDFAGSATEALEQLAQAAGEADDEETKQWEQVMADLSESRAEASKSKERCEELQAQHAQMTQSFANAVKECEDAASVAFGALGSFKQSAEERLQQAHEGIQNLGNMLEASRAAEKGLICERDDLVASLSNVTGERDALTCSLSDMTCERDELSKIVSEVTGARDLLASSLETMTGDRDALSASLDQTSSTILSMKSSLKTASSALLQQVESALAREAELSARLETVESDKARLEAEVATLGSALEGAQELVTSLTDGAKCGAEREGQLSGERDALSASLEEAQADLATIAGERDALSEDLEEVKRQKEALSESLAEAIREWDAVSEEKVSVVAERDAVIAERDTLSTSLEHAVRQVASLETDVSRLSGELGSANEQVESLTDRCKEAEEALGGSQEQILRLGDEITGLKGGLEASEGEREAGLKREEHLRGEVESMEAVHQEKDDMINELRAEKEELMTCHQAEVEELINCHKAVQAEKEELIACHQAEVEELINCHQAEKEELTTSKSSLEASLEEARGERDALQVAKDAIVVEKGELLADLSSLALQKDETSGERDALSAALEEAKASIEEARGERDALSAALEEAKASNEEARGERDALSAEKSALTEEKDKIDASLTEAQSLLDSMASEKERMSREMSEAQNLVDSMASKLEVARESAKRKVEQLQEEHRAEMETLREQAEAGEELRIKVEALEKDNGKLTAQNVHLVGHNNLKQRINMHAKVKEENNELKRNRLDLERQLSHQKSLVKRLAKHCPEGAAAKILGQIQKEEAEI